MFSDAHCHLDEFAAPEKEIAECRKAKVVSVVSNSVDLLTMKKNIALAEKFKEVKAALGIHPSNLLRMSRKEITEALSFVEENIGSAAAIGEIGLDYKHADTQAKKEKQKKSLELQLGIAERFGKPAIVHSRLAVKDTIGIIKGRDCGILFHWFSGSLAELREAIELGAFFSVGPAVEANPSIREIAKAVPGNRLLSETDSPVPFGGQNSAPHWIPRVVDALAEARGEKAGKTAKEIGNNFKKFF
ncbi:MAG: TatD family hydrolase [Candidatus Diapherotrites archaeon]